GGGAGRGLAVAMVLPFGGEKKLIIGTGAGIVAAGICLGLGGQLAWSLLGAGYWAMGVALWTALGFAVLVVVILPLGHPFAGLLERSGASLETYFSQALLGGIPLVVLGAVGGSVAGIFFGPDNAWISLVVVSSLYWALAGVAILYLLLIPVAFRSAASTQPGNPEKALGPSLMLLGPMVHGP